MITLETGVGIEGIPTHWDDKEVVITYPNNSNYTVIFNPDENIMMVSVLANQGFDDEQMLDNRMAIDNIVAEESEVVRLDHFEPDPTMRVLKLADLYLKKKEAIKDQLDKHFKQRVATMPQAPCYDTPDFTK